MPMYDVYMLKYASQTHSKDNLTQTIFRLYKIVKCSIITHKTLKTFSAKNIGGIIGHK